MKNKGKIKSFAFNTILFFMMQGMLLGTCVDIYVKNCGTDAWMVPILGTIIGIIPLFIFTKLRNYDSNKNINDLNKSLFGNKLGNTINSILTLCVIFFIMIALWNLVNFISSQYLYKTPELFIILAFALSIVYILTKDIIIISRSFVIFLFIEIALLGLSIIGLFGLIKSHELFPILQTGFKPIFYSSFNHIALIILPMFLTNIIANNEISNSQNINKNIFKTYLLGNFISFIVVFFNITVLGIELVKLYQYSEFQILIRVSLGGFLQRVEASLSIFWIFDLFTFIVFGSYYVKKSLAQIFTIKKEKKYNKIFCILLLIICIFSNYIFSNNTIVNNFAKKGYNYFAFFSLFLIPFIIYLFTKKKKNKNS